MNILRPSNRLTDCLLVVDLPKHKKRYIFFTGKDEIFIVRLDRTGWFCVFIRHIAQSQERNPTNILAFLTINLL